MLKVQARAEADAVSAVQVEVSAEVHAAPPQPSWCSELPTPLRRWPLQDGSRVRGEKKKKNKKKSRGVTRSRMC